MKNIILLGLVALLPAAAATLQVGADKTYKTPCAAALAASDGDRIEIAAATYSGDVCTIYRNGLTLVGTGGRPVLDAAGKSSQGKAIWVIAGNDTTVENIEFTGAKVPDKNGAGIRQEGKNLTVRNCYFHHNEDGILSGANAGSEILIEYTEFAYNGAGDGYSHNMYIGHIGKFTLRYSYSHHSIEGHLVKTRAAENYVLYNRLTDEAEGTGSFELDFPNGGRTYVIGNVIQQGPNSHNARILNYRAEGPNPNNPSTQLYVVNNTFVNDRARTDDVFLAIDQSNPQPVPAVVKNNIFFGSARLTTQANMIAANNVITSDPIFVDAAHYDYRLKPGAKAIDAGADPGAGDGFSLAPALQYVHPACSEGRQTYGSVMDAGAFEFGSSAAHKETLNRCRKIADSGVVNSASLMAGAVAPGSLITIFGSNLADGIESAGVTPLPVQLQGVSVTVNGRTAPLYYVSPTQINAQLPYETEAGTAQVIVNTPVLTTAPASFAVSRSGPGIFTWDGTRAIVQNSDWKINNAANPARPGDLIIVYMTGQGQVDNPVANGVPVPLTPLSKAMLPVQASIGGKAAAAELFLMPTLVGVLQANAIVPPDAPAGDQPLSVSIDGVRSNEALVAIAAKQ